MKWMKITLIALLLQGIPESIALVTLAFVIAKISIKWNKIILIGSILAICAFFIRQLLFPFGIHMIVNLILLFIFLIRQGGGDLSLSLISSLSSFLALLILETVCSSLLMPVLGLTPKTLSLNSGIGILIGEPQVLLLFGLAFLLNKFYMKRGQKNGYLVH